MGSAKRLLEFLAKAADGDALRGVNVERTGASSAPPYSSAWKKELLPDRPPKAPIDGRRACTLAAMVS